MRRLWLTLRARSPLAIRADHAPDGSATTRFIPGTTLQGSLAAAHRLLWPKAEADFTRLFLEERVFYAHLYPASFAMNTVGVEVAHLPIKPLPKTAQSCKRFGGFRPVAGEEPDERHGIRDSLLDRAAFALLEGRSHDIPALLESLKHLQNCAHPGCGQPLDHVDGYYRRVREEQSQRMQAKSHRRLQTRTGINREWGVVEENILYNREVFDEGALFWGEVLFPDEQESAAKDSLSEKMRTLLKEAAPWHTGDGREAKTGVLRIGTGRSRGLGSVEANPKDGWRESKEDFRKRLVLFDDALRSRAAEVKAQAPHAFYFAVTLDSVAILRDTFLRYQQSLDPVTLAAILRDALVRVRRIEDKETPAAPDKGPPPKLTLLYQTSGLQQVSGWNELWGTPRPVDYALEAGSVFLFASTSDLDDQLLDALEALEEEGIGDRRAEGFGRISVSDQFHLEREQR